MRHLLTLGEKTSRGHIYSAENFADAASNGFIHSAGAGANSSIRGHFNDLHIQDGIVVATITLYGIANDLTQYLEFSPSGIGEVDEGGNVTNYKMTHVELWRA